MVQTAEQILQEYEIMLDSKGLDIMPQNRFEELRKIILQGLKLRNGLIKEKQSAEKRIEIISEQLVEEAKKQNTFFGSKPHYEMMALRTVIKDIDKIMEKVNNE